MSNVWISRAFVAAGIINIAGVLLFSRGLTNDTLWQWDPVLFSPFGLLLIMLWGGAYIAASSRYLQLPGLSLVFAAEKLLYVVAWCVWLSNHGSQLPQLFEQQWLTGLFFSVYGLNDALFMLIFLYAFYRARHSQVRANQMT
ncbi:hypothetical protein FCL40_09345 [Ferrimonas sediminicola]|uniref:Uncharacterized protein n=1 Tax=Ferrimonas sediminicola TaxID=2569538 RepID=A0A4U1BDJ8_9GAMM|nr:hypothetical protein [Ferrimonas sediminicola]TKB48838.1 hypothetical protein FCL40_09345 [Ferrimonas sediminicola]